MIGVLSSVDSVGGYAADVQTSRCVVKESGSWAS